MKPTVRKVKDIRGRRVVGHKAKFGPVECMRPTPKEAALTCEHETLSALARLDRGARVLRWRGHVAVVAPTLEGWSYWVDTLSNPYFMTTPKQDREDAENDALHHLAQGAWNLDVPDDEAFLNAEPSADGVTEECGLPYIVRDLLRPWIRWQRSYAALRAKGFSETEAHQKACSS
jgi:hypothetical protein